MSGTEDAERNKAHTLCPIYFYLSPTLFQIIQQKEVIVHTFLNLYAFINQKWSSEYS